MNDFIFENKTKVYFGKGGAKAHLGSLLRSYGDAVMLAYGGGSIKRNGVYDEVTAILKDVGKTVVEFPGIMPNPTYAKVQEGAKLAREHHVDLILAVGTGSEMNCGAVITHEEKKIKGALWGAQADFAFLDPSYTLSVPMKQVISGAFDTLSHAMETYFGKPDENNLSDDINEAVMRSTIHNIRVLLTDPQNYKARSELAWASAMAENGILKIGKVTGTPAVQQAYQMGRSV